MKVGEYVRYQNKISKIVDIDNKTFSKPAFSLDISKGIYQSLECLENVKHSKDILDLIEVGDYVNGHLVIAIDDDRFVEIEVGYDLEQGELLSQEDIKSIVTKEQFSQMEYKI